MNLKYYLRGLGIGILVTAVVMSFWASGKPETLSDAEIRKRATELGMTGESVVLSKLGEGEETKLETEELQATEEPQAEQQPASEMESTPVVSEIESTPVATGSSTETPIPLPTTAPTATPLPTTTPTATPLPTTTPTVTPLPTTIPTATEPTTSGMGLPAEDIKEVTIKVNGGDGSYTVCRKLEEAGLISSALEYDAYLCKNGYDKKIRVGSYNIPAGADQETIAKMITGK